LHLGSSCVGERSGVRNKLYSGDVREWQMNISEYTLEHTPVKGSPECPKCTTPIYLARIAPDEPGFVRRSFECPRCQHVEITVVKFK
jgi:hypothetical protein